MQLDSASGCSKEDWRVTQLRTWLYRLSARVIVRNDDCGQDLIEYALIVALIAFAAAVGMNSVATGINTAFSTVASHLPSAIT